MKKLVLSLTILLLTLYLSSCCRTQHEFNNPRLPTVIRGWEEHPLGKDTIIYGDFVLRHGESVDNGKIGIEVLELHPAKCGLFVKAWEELPSVRLRFFRISDHKVILDDTFRRGSARLDTITNSPEDMMWSVIEVSDVNAKDNWVAFNLRKK